MATKTFEELKQLAIQIRDEKTNKQNTATRIGTQMLEHLDKLEQDYYDKTATDEKLIELEGKINRNVYTNDAVVNSVIKFLYIDTENYNGNYILEGLKITIISRGLSNKFGFVVRNVNDELILETWQNQEPEYINIAKNGIKIYAIYDWSAIELGTNYSTNALLLPLTFNVGNSPFIDNERIIDGSVTMEKLNADVSSSLNSLTFTKEYKYNTVIRKLFLDTSEYTGSTSLDGLKIGILAKNVSGKWGIQLRNNQNETIISAWMNSQQSVQSVTVDGIYLYAEYNWENKEEGGSNPIEITNEVYNKANDPRESVTPEKLHLMSI